MLKRVSLFAAVLAAVALAVVVAQEKAKEPEKVDVPEMKTDEVKEIAPGVFFRLSSISATDKKVPFGGSNHTWIVFKEYVVVIDANFPKEAGDVLAAIKKTTDKPVKYVFDTHHHGDHAWGNAVWAKAGATVIGSKECARLLKTSGPAEFENEQKKLDGRKDVKDAELKQVDEAFSETLAIDDGSQRVEFHFLGHAHTAGDAVAYLPKHKIICTGDMCVNGAFNFCGHSDTGSWVKVLEKAEKFDVKLVCPGHGPVAGRDVLAKQRRWFEELRAAVKKGVDDKKELKDITAGLSFEWYEKWTGVKASERGENAEHVYKELTGKIDHTKLGRLPTPGGEAVARGTDTK